MAIWLLQEERKHAHDGILSRAERITALEEAIATGALPPQAVQAAKDEVDRCRQSKLVLACRMQAIDMVNDTKARNEIQTGKASDVVRQISLAVVAVAWLIAGQKAAGLHGAGLVSVGLAGLALLADLFQYVVNVAVATNQNALANKNYIATADWFEKASANATRGEFSPLGMRDPRSPWPQKLFAAKVGLTLSAVIVMVFSVAQQVFR